MIHRVILFLLVSPTVVMADGKVFSMMAAETRVPDQQALIRWTDGEECLVVETRFGL